MNEFLTHSQSLPKGKELFVKCMTVCRNKPDFIQFKNFQGINRCKQVTDVGRIETPTEDADPSRAFHFSIKKRRRPILPERCSPCLPERFRTSRRCRG